MRIVVVICALLVSACGAQEFARFPSSLPSALEGASAELDASKVASNDRTLVVLRFPATFSPAALQRANTEWGGKNDTYMYRGNTSPLSRNQNLQLPDPAALAITRTNYYVYEFYAALRSMIPAERIILRPEVVELEGDRFVYKSRNNTYPTVVTVDFHVSSGMVLLEPASTVGQYVVPLVTVSTARAAAPKTLGALLKTRFAVSSYGAAENDGGESDTTADYDGGGGGGGMADSQGVELAASEGGESDTAASSEGVEGGMGEDLVYQLNHYSIEKFDSNIPGSTSWPPKTGEVLIVPGMSYRLPREKVETQGHATIDDPSNAASGELMKFYATAVVHMLNHLDHEVAYKAAHIAYVRQYDSRLAKRMESGKLTRLDQRKLRDIDGALRQEQKALQRAAEAGFENLYLDKFGDETRAALSSEMQQYNELVARRDQATAVMVLAALAGAASAVQAGRNGGSPSAAAQIAATTAIQIMAMAQVSQMATGAVKRSMTALIVGETSVLGKIVVNFRGQRYEFEPTTFEKLQAKMVSLYRHAYRIRGKARV